MQIYVSISFYLDKEYANLSYYNFFGGVERKKKFCSVPIGWNHYDWFRNLFYGSKKNTVIVVWLNQWNESKVSNWHWIINGYIILLILRHPVSDVLYKYRSRNYSQFIAFVFNHFLCNQHLLNQDSIWNW